MFSRLSVVFFAVVTTITAIALAKIGIEVVRADPTDMATAPLIFLGAFVFLAMQGFAWYLSRNSQRPYENLLAKVEKMHQEPSMRLHQRANDLVGRLGNAINELAERISCEQEMLEEDRNRRIAVLESMAEGVLVTGPKNQGGVIVMANAALREMLLLDRPILGRTPIEVLRLPGLDELLERAEQSGDVVVGEIDLVGLRAGRILVRVSCLQTPDVHVAGLVAVFSDVTELRRLEKVRKDFVANVSHELRTPIMAISSAAETLLGGALHDTTAAKDFLNIVERHARRLSKLVDDLLELSRVESREWRLRPQAIEPYNIVQIVMDSLSIVADQRHGTLSNRVEISIGYWIADPRALEQVLVNLIDNALKYGGNSPLVEVFAMRIDNRIRLEVRDHGVGIEPRHVGRLFERFYRVDTGRSRAIGGTGLGLSIVKNLSEAMGGSVRVESAVGQGSSFFVTLPAVDRAEQVPASTSSTEVRAVEQITQP